LVIYAFIQINYFFKFSEFFVHASAIKFITERRDDVKTSREKSCCI